MRTLAHPFFYGKRLVVFGAGYIGGEVARQALARGLRVTVLTRNSGTASALAATGLETVVADLATTDWHARIPSGAEFALNSVSAGGGGEEGYRRSYVEGQRSLLQWARATSVGTLVYTSSTSVYPQGGGTIVDETAPTAAAEGVARILVEAETLLQTQGAAACRRWFILRLAGIYGPERHLLLDQLRAGAAELPGRGDCHLNLAHRDDICAAIWAAFGAPPEQGNAVFNVADDGAATRNELAGWLADQLGRAATRFSGAPAGGRRGITPDRVIANTRLKAALGWSPLFPTFREGYGKILSQ